MKRIANGQWQNPAKLNPPDPERVREGLSRVRRAEVEAGTWRNPALDAAAREKLSRPRKHTGVLASAIDKLDQGLSVSELSLEEQEAHREYRRQLRQARREEANEYHRRRYHKLQAQMTPEEKEVQRAKWREANRRKAGRRGEKKNQ